VKKTLKECGSSELLLKQKLGVPKPKIREIAKRIGKNQK